MNNKKKIVAWLVQLCSHLRPGFQSGVQLSCNCWWLSREVLPGNTYGRNYVGLSSAQFRSGSKSCPGWFCLPPVFCHPYIIIFLELWFHCKVKDLPETNVWKMIHSRIGLKVQMGKGQFRTNLEWALYYRQVKTNTDKADPSCSFRDFFLL